MERFPPAMANSSGCRGGCPFLPLSPNAKVAPPAAPPVTAATTELRFFLMLKRGGDVGFGRGDSGREAPESWRRPKLLLLLPEVMLLPLDATEACVC